MRPVSITVTPTASDNDGISTTQTPSGAGNLTITGALASGGVATLSASGFERQVLISCAGVDAGRTFTVYGTNGNADVFSEAISGSNASTSVSTNYFQTVTRISVDAATAGAVIVGTNGVGASVPIVIDRYLTPTNISIQLDISNTIDVTVQYTIEDIMTTAATYGTVVWNSHSTLVSKTADSDGTFTSPVSAFRTKVNSFTATGACETTVMQAGIR